MILNQRIARLARLLSFFTAGVGTGAAGGSGQIPVGKAGTITDVNGVPIIQMSGDFVSLDPLATSGGSLIVDQSGNQIIPG